MRNWIIRLFSRNNRNKNKDFNHDERLPWEELMEEEMGNFEDVIEERSRLSLLEERDKKC